MTREEAIMHIDGMINTTIIVKGIVPDEYDIEALRMAIEALSANAVHNDSCDECKYIGVIEKCEQCRRIYTEFDDLYDKGGDDE